MWPPPQTGVTNVLHIHLKLLTTRSKVFSLNGKNSSSAKTQRVGTSVSLLRLWSISMFRRSRWGRKGSVIIRTLLWTQQHPVLYPHQIFLRYVRQNHLMHYFLEHTKSRSNAQTRSTPLDPDPKNLPCSDVLQCDFFRSQRPETEEMTCGDRKRACLRRVRVKRNQIVNSPGNVVNPICHAAADLQHNAWRQVEI